MPIGGHDVTKFILNSIKDRTKIPMEELDNMMAVAQNVKEKYGYVCRDVLKAFKKYDKLGTTDEGKHKLGNKFHHFSSSNAHSSKYGQLSVKKSLFFGCTH